VRAHKRQGFEVAGIVVDFERVWPGDFGKLCFKPLTSKPNPIAEPTMRQERTIQATIFEVFAGHQIGCELKVVSAWLDGQRALVGLVASDLRREGVCQTGRRGLPAETGECPDFRVSGAASHCFEPSAR
jgi:hypothetical protein